MYDITNPSIDDLLRQYRKNAKYSLGYFDTENTENNYLGIARMSSACSPTNSAYIVEKRYDDPSLAARTMAIQIGHILGMWHRPFDDGPMKGLDSRDEWIWSKCHNDDFRSFYFWSGYTCLF